MYVTAAAAIADADVQEAVGPEGDVAAVVVVSGSSTLNNTISVPRSSERAAVGAAKLRDAVDEAQVRVRCPCR